MSTPSKKSPVQNDFPQALRFIRIIRIKIEAEGLLKKIARMDNVYGYSARHYIKNGNSIGFILQFNNEINEGFPIADKILKGEIEDFVKKYNELLIGNQEK